MSNLSLTKQRVKTPEDVVYYLLDCTLATVSSMAMKKSRPVGEYNRQISIAQFALDSIVNQSMGTEFHTGRGGEIIRDYACDVNLWARQYEVSK